MPSESDINVLICSANIGNREPSEKSIAAWIPDDGDVKAALDSTRFPLKRVTVSRQGKFDFIVIGLQEATFERPSKNDFYQDDDNVNDIDSMMEESNLPERRSSLTASDIEEDILLRLNSKKPLKKRFFDVSHSIYDPSTNGQQHDVMSNSTHNIYSKSKHKHVSTAKKNDVMDKMILQPKITTIKVVNVVRSVTASEDYTRQPMYKKITQHQFEADTRIIHNLVSSRCPSYKFIVEYLRGQMRLIVLVRNTIVNEVESVECKAENTGIGGILANKGGITAYITIRKTRLAFISAHLEAHEGREHYLGRCANIAEIFNGTKAKKSLYDATISTHHCFVFGDLNFRIVPQCCSSNSDSNSSDAATFTEKFERVCKLVKRREWKKLQEEDELHNALRNGHCLTSFRTIKCRFPPTFKVIRDQNSFTYNPTRIPSYTDRILWNSVRGLHDCVLPFVYEACADFTTSDHKPIRGAFAVTTNSPKPTPLSRTNAYRRSLFSHIDNLSTMMFRNNATKLIHFSITNLACIDLKRPGSKFISPYVIFTTSPAEYLSNQNKLNKLPQRFREKFNPTQITHNGHPITKVVKRCTDPSWEDEEFSFTIKASLEEIALTGAMLYLTVMNCEYAPKDTHIGTVRLSLKEICSSESYDDAAQSNHSLDSVLRCIDIHEPVMKIGLVHGYLRCTIQVFHLFEDLKISTDDHNLSTKKNNKDRNSDCLHERRAGLYKPRARLSFQL